MFDGIDGIEVAYSIPGLIADINYAASKISLNVQAESNNDIKNSIYAI